MDPRSNSDPSVQPDIYEDDAHRLCQLEAIQGEGRERLAAMMITLYAGFSKYGCEGVKAEIGRFAELLFRSSEVYRLALIPLHAPGHVIGGLMPQELLRQLVERHMPEFLPKAKEEDT